MAADEIPNPKRALITFAAVHDELQRSNDFLRGVAPLFASIAEDFKGQIYSHSVFQRELRTQFGLRVPDEIVETMAPRLASVGLLERMTSGGDPLAYIWRAPSESPVEASHQFSERLDAVISEFQSFINDFPSAVVTSYRRDEVETFLFDFLLSETPELEDAYVAVSGGDASHDKQRRKYYSEGEYLASRFVQHMQAHRNQNIVDTIAGIKSAILVSEVVVELGTARPARQHTVDVNVYIDAPLMMHYLNVSGRARFDFAKQVIGGLGALGAKIYIFDHSIDEIRDNLRAVLLNRGTRTGPTADAIRRREVEEAFVSQVMHNPEYAVENTDVSIVRLPEVSLTAAQKAYFSEADDQRLFSLMSGIHRRQKALERDVLSAKIVIARRQGRPTTNLFRCRHLLITDNGAVSRATRRFMIEDKGAQPIHVPPAVTLGRVAAAVWLEVGLQEKLDISRKHLIATCARAVTINPGIVEQIKRNLQKINPENAPQYEVILDQPRYMQMAMDFTLGSPDAVTEQSAKELFDRVREDITREERQKLNKSLKELSRVKEQVISEKDAEITALKEKLSAEESGRMVAFEGLVVPRLRRAGRSAAGTVYGVFLIGLLGLAFTAFSHLSQGSATALASAGFVFSAAMMILGFWGITGSKIRGLLEGWLVARIKRNMSSAGFEAETKRAVLDVRQGKVIWRDRPLVLDV